jgi:aminoglycoside phosphotransferase (APT) family kinase protein
MRKVDMPMDTTPIAALLTHRYGVVREARFEMEPLHGGLVSQVFLVSARFVDPSGRSRSRRMVMKRLEGRERREAHIYEALLKETTLAPRSMGVQRDADGRQFLFLEALPLSEEWPWTEVEASRTVLRRAAEVHAMGAPAHVTQHLPDWDYEAELVAEGHEAVELLWRARRNPLLEASRFARPLSRIVEAVPAIRQQLLAFQPFGRTLIHGDLHCGNVRVLPADHVGSPVVFIDWARTRIGSPLEDVSSWLQSLGFWEQVAKQRHDTLLCDYLDAGGYSRRLDADLRSAYWLAGACNALGGALTHWLRLATRETGAADRAVALARDWLRIVRRADACFGGSC